MKKTLFVAMLAAALLGGQVFAATGTAIDGAKYTQGTKYYGKYSETESVTGGSVTIKADPSGEVSSSANVYGGYASVGDASSNILTMTGGKVSSIYGGYSDSASSNNNTVVMTGGVLSLNLNVAQVRGHSATASASENVAIITGGTITNALTVASATAGTLTNNRLHLVGKGASNVSIVNGQGNTSSYSNTDSEAGIKLGSMKVAESTNPTLSGNSIDIYGTGITVSRNVSGMQILTFNITDGQVTGQTTEAALSLTSVAGNNALKLQDVELQVKDLDVKAWTPGKTITLVEARVAIQGLESGKVVDITKNGQVVALGQLVLSNENKTLSLSVQGSVPEPATGSLFLLALAGLCIRRRRK